MTWPFKVPEVEEKPKDEQPPPEKTPAELIADSLKPTLDALTQRFDTFENRIKTVEDQTKPREPNQPVNQEGPTSVLDDENLAFAQRLTPLMARQLELESRIVKTDVKNEYISAGLGDTWLQFEGEINGVLEQTPLVKADGSAYRGDPQYIRNVVDMIFGRAARKGGMKFDGNKKSFFLETGSGGVEGGGQPEADGLTESQRKVMARMHVPIDDAKKVIKKLHFVS